MYFFVSECTPENFRQEANVFEFNKFAIKIPFAGVIHPVAGE
jgi:hypothetical protein